MSAPAPADRVLRRVLAWADRDGNIRRVVLVGSRARGRAPDDLADIDLRLVCGSTELYTREESWLSEIGRVWVCVRDEYTEDRRRVPTRLVIFEGGVKVDFAFYPAGAPGAGLPAGLPSRVLLDKDRDRSVREMDKTSSPQPGVPDEAEFRRVVEEFWFETYHIAKYLARHELWLARERDWAAKRFLLRMIYWHEGAVRRHASDVGQMGQRASMSPQIWHDLRGMFAGFDREESWGATIATMDLFRRLAREVAGALGFVYPDRVDEDLTLFISALRKGERGAAH